MAYLVENLLESIKQRSFAPISQSTFQDSNLISLANEELDLNLVADLVAAREDFFLTNESTSIRESVSHYSIPSRAIGNALKTLFYVYSADSRPQELTLIDPSRRGEYAATSSSPEAYYFEGDEVVLVPMPNSATGSLLFSFAAKPNQLIATSSCAKISTKTQNVSTMTFGVDTDLTASLAVGSYVDILSAVSPFKLWTYRAAIVSIASSTIELSLTDVLDMAGAVVEPQVGDYICPTGYANIPQIPIAYHVVLAQSVVVRMLEGLGDLNKQTKAEQTLQKLEQKALSLIQNRVETTPKKISTRGKLVRYFR